MRGKIPWLVLVVIAALAALLIPASVSGHAEYDHSTPARDEVVQTAPTRVDVFFKQEVFRQEGENYVRVFNDSGDQITEGDGVIDDDDRTHIFADMPADVPPGRYIVQWKTLSDTDGDDDSGAFCFYVQTEPTQAQRDECAAFEGDEETPQATGSATEAAPTTEATVPATEPTSTPVASAGSDDDSGVSSAVIIAGIIVGGVVVLAIVAGAFILLRRTLE